MIPNYRLLYEDMLRIKYPDKFESCIPFLKKKKWTNIDVIKINKIIVENHLSEDENQRFKAYDKQTIYHILDYQKKEKLTNLQVAAHFKLSRNTLTKWKRSFF